MSKNSVEDSRNREYVVMSKCKFYRKFWYVFSLGLNSYVYRSGCVSSKKRRWTHRCHFGVLIKSEEKIECWIFFMAIVRWRKRKIIFLKAPVNFWKLKLCRAARAAPGSAYLPIFWIGFLKIYLIGSIVPVLENRIKCFITLPYYTIPLATNFVKFLYESSYRVAMWFE